VQRAASRLCRTVLAVGLCACSTGYTVRADDIHDAQRRFAMGENDPYVPARDEDGEPVLINASHIESVEDVDFDIGCPGEPDGISGQVTVEKDDIDQTVRRVGWLAVGLGGLIAAVGAVTLSIDDAPTHEGVVLATSGAALGVAGAGLVVGSAFIPGNQPIPTFGVSGRF